MLKMCYHYSIAKTAQEIASMYNIELRSPEINPEPLFYHVNGFDHHMLPVIYKGNKDSYLKYELMSWGLIPAWVQNELEAKKIRNGTLNARSETLESKPSFSSAFRYRPCLVPSTGYFEWMHKAGNKYPYFIFLKSVDIFSFAGIWEEWVNSSTGEILRSFSVITCDSNSFTSEIHNTNKRMPVILQKDDEGNWLNTDLERPTRMKLLKPYDPDKMDAHTISRDIARRTVNSDRPSLIEHFKYPELN